MCDDVDAQISSIIVFHAEVEAALPKLGNEERDLVIIKADNDAIVHVECEDESVAKVKQESIVLHWMPSLFTRTALRC